MEAAYLLAQLALALGVLGIIGGAVAERARQLGLLTGGEER